MAGKSLALTLLLCVAAIGARAASREEIVPAGTLLRCTMDEPNFSSKTAQAGDPVLCHLGPISSFGRSLFPRGAMLSGHLQDSKDPGHFVGKGWLDLEFDRIILPGAQVMPLAAKIIATPHLKTDREGKIRGGGHPRRDVVEWMIPVLWPIKIMNLPRRGPYPTLKGEQRLTLRLMEDVVVPLSIAQASVPSPPWAAPTDYIPSPYGLMRPASLVTRETVGAETLPPTPVLSLRRTSDVASLQPVVQEPLTESLSKREGPSSELGSARPVLAQQSGESRLTLVVLKGGSAFLSTNYWVQGGQVQCISQDGEQKSFPLESVDLYQTVRLNRERNIEFVLRSKDAVTEQ